MNILIKISRTSHAIFILLLIVTFVVEYVVFEDTDSKCTKSCSENIAELSVHKILGLFLKMSMLKWISLL